MQLILRADVENLGRLGDTVSVKPGYGRNYLIPQGLAMAPVVEEQDIVYLGEGHTPLVAANDALTELVGAPFFYKNDGQNPSASFKDRGMPRPICCPRPWTWWWPTCRLSP